MKNSEPGIGSPQLQKSARPSANQEQQSEAPSAEQQIAINGFQQVLEMLKIADPAFRESLLRRLAARDRNMAQRLREDLIESGY